MAGSWCLHGDYYETTPDLNRISAYLREITYIVGILANTSNPVGTIYTKIHDFKLSSDFKPTHSLNPSTA